MSLGTANDVFEAADQTAMLALAAAQGDWCYRTDTKNTWRLTGVDPTDIGDWLLKGLPQGVVIYTDEATGDTRIDRGDEAGTFLMRNASASGGGGSGNLDGGSANSVYGGTSPVDGGIA